LNAYAFIYPTDQHSGIWSIVQGFQEEANVDHRRTVAISADSDSKEETNLIGRLAEFDVKGAAVYPLITSAEEHVHYCQMLLKCPFTVVLVDINLIGLGLPAVIGDGFDAGYTMTRYLLAQGLQKIGFLSESASKGVIRDRFHGYQLAMREAAGPFDERWILTEPGMHLDMAHPLDEPEFLARRLLEQAPELEAVVAGNSYVAMGCIHVARSLGIAVPERLRVVSLDGWGPTEEGVQLTHYSIDNQEMGRLAYQTLRMAIENQQLPQSEVVVRGRICPGTTG
jgi:DNA-binding LacI/PurR family transcriptional regulator